ncbi:hypothetical protein QCA50_013268 [Cerrena zonata]|uniref:Uncharacterized protein n=1 Tax=Cerrena zonata TaxID=2478898 RepID=A0AAW0FTK6_9APHY
MSLLDLLVEALVGVIDKTKGSIDTPKWGAETTRLVPPAALIKMIVEKGSIVDLAPPTIPPAGSAPPPGVIPWMYPPLETGKKGDITRLTKLSKEATAKLHQLTNEHGRTVTQVITALSALAHIEAFLNIAGRKGNERFKLVSEAYEASNFYLVAFNFVNHRHKLPGGYHDFKSAVGAPLCAIDGMPIMAPAKHIKALVKVDTNKKIGVRQVDEGLFWKAVEDIASGWKGADLSLDAWYQREIEKEIGAKFFDPSMFGIPAIIMSSIGDTDRLGLFKHVHPSSGNKTLIVEDIITGIRLRAPPPMNLLYQYDGQLQCHWMTGGEYNTAEEMELVTDIFEARLSEILRITDAAKTIVA